MKVQSFETMELAYDFPTGGLDADDLSERNKLLTNYPYSVIIEGGHMEFDSLYQWIKQHMAETPAIELYYGKTDYDYGFAEFFFSIKLPACQLAEVVPRIFTLYPNAYPERHISRTNGRNKNTMHIEFITYDPTDKNAIVYHED